MPWYTQVRKRHATRESSLVVGIMDISWMMPSMLALTPHRQHTKTQVHIARYVEMATYCMYSARTTVLSEPPQKVSQIYERRGRKKQISKIKYCCTDIYVHSR